MDIEIQSKTAAESGLDAIIETRGRLSVPYLYQYWQQCWRQLKSPMGKPVDKRVAWDLQNTLMSGLGMNVLETSRFIYSNRNTDFEAFEEWILEINGGAIEEERLRRLRRALRGERVSSAAGSLERVPGLSGEQRACWDDNGYVIVPEAATPENCKAAAAAIYEALGADPDDPESWYGNKFGKSIWVPVLRHPAFLANRNSPRLVKAFADLWGREDLWPTIDQGGLNPPERADWKFPGPHIHWDVSIAKPHHLGLQGILYLTDTPAEQGAFSCITGFHRTLDQWLDSLPEGTDPRQALHQLPGMKPIAGKAGDLVIWHELLPHGSSPNRGTKPRVAQYISLRPTRYDFAAVWL